MITHKKVRGILNNVLIKTNQYLTIKDFNEIKKYINEQEKKDELLELYKEYFQIVERGDNDWHYRMNEIPEQIKALEEELK